MPLKRSSSEWSHSVGTVLRLSAIFENGNWSKILDPIRFQGRLRPNCLTVQFEMTERGSSS